MLNKIIDEAKATGALKSGQDIKEVSYHLISISIEIFHFPFQDAMAMDTTIKSDHSITSLKNSHGNYPKWVSKRKIQQMKKVKQKKKITKKQAQKKSKV